LADAKRAAHNAFEEEKAAETAEGGDSK
jgi:hypothetical protein